jgi:hypothetical protein
MTDRRGLFMQTRGGGRFYPEDPRPEDFDATSIAHALALVNRYNGHTPVPYSVAQHSVLVSLLVENLGGNAEERLWGLLHDASEAYICDMPSPVKRLLPDYQRIERRVMRAILSRFSLGPDMPASVKEADEIALATEAHVLFGPELVRAWGLKHEPVLGRLPGAMAWPDAEEAFLCRLAKLWEG